MVRHARGAGMLGWDISSVFPFFGGESSSSDCFGKDIDCVTGNEAAHKAIEQAFGELQCGFQVIA